MVPAPGEANSLSAGQAKEETRGKEGRREKGDGEKEKGRVRNE